MMKNIGSSRFMRRLAPGSTLPLLIYYIRTLTYRMAHTWNWWGISRPYGRTATNKCLQSGHVTINAGPIDLLAATS